MFAIDCPALDVLSQCFWESRNDCVRGAWRDPLRLQRRVWRSGQEQTRPDDTLGVLRTDHPLGGRPPYHPRGGLAPPPLAGRGGLLHGRRCSRGRTGDEQFTMVRADEEK